MFQNILINLCVLTVTVMNTYLFGLKFSEGSYWMSSFLAVSTAMMLWACLYAMRLMTIAKIRGSRVNLMWSDWEPFFLLLPRKIDGHWYWMSRQFRRRRYKEYDDVGQALLCPPKVSQFGTLATVMKTDKQADLKEIEDEWY